MSTTQIFILLSVSFSCACASYAPAADQYCWPKGRMFTENTIPNLASLATIALALGLSAGLFMQGKVGLLWGLWLLAAYFLGGATITHVLRKHSGWLSLCLAPFFSIAGLFSVL